MKKYIWLAAIAIILVTATVFGLCFLGDREEGTLQLAAPVLTLDEELIASWNAVKGAEGYMVNVNGSDLSITSALRYPGFTASGTYTVKVQAVSGAVRGPYSNEVSYTVYSVTLPTDRNYTVNGKNYVLPGADYSFTLTLSPAAYNSQPVVKVNGLEVTPVEGVYTVADVTEALVITVEGIVLAKEYPVKLPVGEGYTVTGDKTAVDGLDYTFVLELEADYDQSKPLVKVNGAALEPVDGKYTVKNVTQELTVTVEGVQKNIYQITVPAGSGYTVTNAGIHILERGQELRFTVNAAGGTRALAVTANGSVLQPDAKTGEYVLTADQDWEVQIYTYDLLQSVYAPQNWRSDGWKCSTDSITLSDNSPLSGGYFKQLWEAGYTHLVFTYTSENGAAAYIHGDTSTSDSWTRYWDDLSGKSGKDIRIDLNEFHTGDTWYDMQFINMVDGKGFTVSNVRGYKSAETLQWKKQGIASSNMYFALEDGYYVLETRAGGQYITSPSAWLKKYCVADAQQTWMMYAGYIDQGANTRSLVWGFGEPVDTVCSTADAGWAVKNLMNADGYQEGEVFSLHADINCTARFKMSNIVSNRTEWAPNNFTYTHLGEYSFRFSSEAAEHKLFLQNTSELVAAGYRKLIVTLKGTLPQDVMLWYGDGDWSDGETGIDSVNLIGGSYTFEVDLSKMNGNCFTLMTSGNSAAKKITNLQVDIVPSREALTQTHVLTKNEGEGYTVSGDTYVLHGATVYFRVNVQEGYTAPTAVKVNGQPAVAVDGCYRICNMTQDLTVTVEGVAKKTYSVSLPSGEGYVLTPITQETVLTHGASYSFRLTVQEAYSSSSVTVMNGQTVLTAVGGVYTVSDVTANVVITVTGVQRNTYTVELPRRPDLYTILGSTEPVPYGGSYRFTVTLKAGTVGTLVVKNGQTVLTPKENTTYTYEITNVTENIVISISGVHPEGSFNVYKPSMEEVIVSGDDYAEVGGSYAFTVTVNPGFEGTPVVKVNGGTVPLSGGVYTVTNVQSDLTVTISGITRKKYSVTLPAGSGFTLSGADQAEHGRDYQFTAQVAANTILVLKHGNTVLTPENGYYTVENITGNVVITAQATTVQQLLFAPSAWSSTPAVSASGATVAANSRLKADVLKTLWDAGYTHLVFTYTSANTSGSYIHGGQWDRYWEQLGGKSGKDIRIDLNEFHDGDTWYDLVFQDQPGAMTVSNVRGYKSPETLSWTKSNTNSYFAIEDGYYVLRTGGADTVQSPAQWWEQFRSGTNDEWIVYHDVLEGSAMLQWGWNGTPVDAVGSVGQWQVKYNMTPRDPSSTFSLNTTGSSTVRFQISEFIPTVTPTVTAASKDSITFSMGAGGRLIYAFTQDWLDAGYTKVKITFTGSFGSQALWYGNGDWATPLRMHSAVAGEQTFDLSYLDGKDFEIYANNACSHITVTLTPIP